MIEVERQETILCSPDNWLEFVLDVDRYAEVDDKIGPIRWARRSGNLVEVQFWPRLPGLRLPMLPITSQMRLTRGQRIDVRLAPLPHNLTTHAASKFRASFSCVPLDEGVRVTRRISFELRRPAKRLVEPVLCRTLPNSVDRELRLAKLILEQAGPPT